MAESLASITLAKRAALPEEMVLAWLLYREFENPGEQKYSRLAYDTA